MFRIISVTIFLLLSSTGMSQGVLRGKVMGLKGELISGAKIQVKGQSASTYSDSLGQYTLDSLKLPAELLIHHSDYLPDTIELRNLKFMEIKLQSVSTFELVKVGGGIHTGFIKNEGFKTEVINKGELKKAACCDLAGCFETQGTIQPMTTNIITNSKELRILGLSGVYNQVLIDGMPLIQGLSYTYGISSIPGTMVENIFISKGANSVLQGFESMVGQINVIPKMPDKNEKLLLNAYVNSFAENQYNLNYHFGNNKIQNMISGHMVQPATKWDRDKDGFMDLPQLKRYLIYDKFTSGLTKEKGLSNISGLRFYQEERSGGQLNYRPEKDTGSTDIYGQYVRYKQVDIYSKFTYKVDDNRKFAFYGSGFYQDQNSWFGSINYQANQTNGYANLQYEQIWHRNHELKTGISNRYLLLNENIRFTDTLKRSYAGTYLKEESIQGVFAENIFKWRGDLITLITGLRADHHNRFGWKVTPRAMFKYDMTENTIWRVSAGTGWRTINLFSENIGLLASSRDIIIATNLEPEESFNWGTNIYRKFKKGIAEGFVTMDLYQTLFSNQIFPNFDLDPGKAIIENFKGKSVSNGFQIDINAKLYKKFEVKMAYNYLDVYRVVNGIKRQLPFNSNHKFLMGLSYLATSKKWRADMNAHWFGSRRLPDTDLNPEEYRQAKRSRSYTTLNIQFTKIWKKLELYGGCENLFDFRQLRPIVSWQDPFSPYFDTSFNWGPTRGREIFIGIRYRPLKDKK